MKNNKGFTLIEMLVVIAIIGLLSSVVLVALGPSRNKAKDSRIISDVNQVRAIIEAKFDASTAKYSFVAADYVSLGTDITNNGGVLTVSASGLTTYAVFSTTNSGGYCVDSTGKIGSTIPASGAPTVCP